MYIGHLTISSELLDSTKNKQKEDIVDNMDSNPYVLIRVVDIIRFRGRILFIQDGEIKKIILGKVQKVKLNFNLGPKKMYKGLKKSF